MGIEKREIRQYIRSKRDYIVNEKGNRIYNVIGIMVAKKIPLSSFDTEGNPIITGVNIGIGFSLCNRRDKYNKEQALFIANKRAEADARGDIPTIPDSIYHEVIGFCHRAEKYFKLPENSLVD